MLSFEDFFSKKKIDLSALQSANKPLYDEFKTHYHVMGEKSFDHSKKFWFNKLRKSFLLKEIEITKEKTEKAVEKTQESNTSTSQISLGFKSRFSATTIKTKAKELEVCSENDSINDTKTETSKPTGFKPKFKAGVTKPAQDATAKEQPKIEDNSANEDKAESAKPTGFKPRFKAGVTKTNNKD